MWKFVYLQFRVEGGPTWTSLCGAVANGAFYSPLRHEAERRFGRMRQTNDDRKHCEVCEHTTLLGRYLRFFVLSLAGTLVDIGVLWLCSTFIFHTYVGTYVVSPIISFECGVVTDFVFYYHFVWHERIVERSPRTFGRHLLKFNLSVASTFLLKMGLLILIERLSGGWHVVVCNIIALVFSGLMNFLLSEVLVFPHKKVGKKLPRACQRQRSADIGEASPCEPDAAEEGQA